MADTDSTRRAEGSASDEAHPFEENRRADEIDEVESGFAGSEGSASDELHRFEENRRADESRRA